MFSDLSLETIKHVPLWILTITSKVSFSSPAFDNPNHLATASFYGCTRYLIGERKGGDEEDQKRKKKIRREVSQLINTWAPTPVSPPLNILLIKHWAWWCAVCTDHNSSVLSCVEGHRAPDPPSAFPSSSASGSRLTHTPSLGWRKEMLPGFQEGGSLGGTG